MKRWKQIVWNNPWREVPCREKEKKDNDLSSAFSMYDESGTKPWHRMIEFRSSFYKVCIYRYIWLLLCNNVIVTQIWLRYIYRDRSSNCKTAGTVVKQSLSCLTSKFLRLAAYYFGHLRRLSNESNDINSLLLVEEKLKLTVSGRLWRIGEKAAVNFWNFPRESASEDAACAINILIKLRST